MRVARERGAKVVAITNIMGSAVTREADGVLYTRAGLEIGVAATKTFTAQVVLLTLLALRLAELRHRLPAERLAELAAELQRLPALAQGVLDDPQLDASLDIVAERFAERPLLPLPRPSPRPARLPRGRAEAEGDLATSRPTPTPPAR